MPHLVHVQAPESGQALLLGLWRPEPDEIEAAERFYVEHLMHSPDAIEGLTAFLEKRPPVWAAAGKAKPSASGTPRQRGRFPSGVTVPA